MESMKLTINGENQVCSAETLGALVAGLGMKPDRVAIELNREIVPRDQWQQTPLHDGDRLEIVHFVGGGSGRANASASASILFLNCHPEQSGGSAVRRKSQTQHSLATRFATC